MTASYERPRVIQGEEPRHPDRIQFDLTCNNRQSIVLCAAESRNRNSVLQGFIGDESRKECAADGEKAGMPGEMPRGKPRCERCGNRSKSKRGAPCQAFAVKG